MYVCPSDMTVSWVPFTPRSLFSYPLLYFFIHDNTHLSYKFCVDTHFFLLRLLNYFFAYMLIDLSSTFHIQFSIFFSNSALLSDSSLFSFQSFYSSVSVYLSLRPLFSRCLHPSICRSAAMELWKISGQIRKVNFSQKILIAEHL